jgi:hypothetical protein
MTNARKATWLDNRKTPDSCEGSLKWQYLGYIWVQLGGQWRVFWLVSYAESARNLQLRTEGRQIQSLTTPPLFWRNHLALHLESAILAPARHAAVALPGGAFHPEC